MLKWRGASNTTTLSFSRRALQLSADFVKQRWASRSAAEFFSEQSATIRASRECARSLFSVLKGVASAAGKSSWTKYPRGQTAVKMEQADCPFHGLATGSGRSRTVSHLDLAGS